MTWALSDPTRFNSFLGPFLLKVEDGVARVRMTPRHEHSNLQDNLHGGALLGFIDVALFAAARGFGLSSSLEAFVVCEGFRPPRSQTQQQQQQEANTAAEETGVKAEIGAGMDGSDGVDGGWLGDKENPIFGGAGSGRRTTAEQSLNDDGWIAPFIACGDLSAWDADASYELPPDHVSLDPVQPPTAPPYKRAIEVKRERGGAYGKTKNLVHR